MMKAPLTCLQKCAKWRRQRESFSLWSLFGAWQENTNTDKAGTHGTCTHALCTCRPTECDEPTRDALTKDSFFGCLTSQQHASVSQGRICSDNFMSCHTEIEVADQTFYLTQSQYTDTRPTSPSTDPITPGAWQGSHWSANFEITGMTRPPKILAQAGFEQGIFCSLGGHLNHLANEVVHRQRSLQA